VTPLKAAFAGRVASIPTSGGELDMTFLPVSIFHAAWAGSENTVKQNAINAASICPSPNAHLASNSTCETIELFRKSGRMLT
jgi:hypothetical protein